MLFKIENKSVSILKYLHGHNVDFVKIIVSSFIWIFSISWSDQEDLQGVGLYFAEHF